MEITRGTARQETCGRNTHGADWHWEEREDRLTPGMHSRDTKDNPEHESDLATFLPQHIPPALSAASPRATEGCSGDPEAMPSSSAL